jgi:hypothetical protein
MIQRKYLLAVFSTVLILVLTVTSVAAQTGKPPSTPQPYPHYPSSPSGIGSQATAANVPMGQSGVSFRYLRDIGAVETPYLVDTQHINRPDGLFMDPAGALFVTENQGNRVLKYAADGTNLLAIGKAGMCDTGSGYLCSPSDAATAADGTLWVVDNGTQVIQFSPTGTRLQSYPTQDNAPWQSGSGNDRFDGAIGIAMDSSGRMFIADSRNQRIQIFTFSAGAPVWSATIGETGVPDSNDTHFNTPYRLAFDSSDQLYVLDRGNNRVQRCVEGGGDWTCTTFTNDLNDPQGITVDQSNNVLIADTQNGRILKCAPNGSCATFSDQGAWPVDLAVDGSGNVFYSASYENVVYKIGSDGSWLGAALGVENTPYLTDGAHFNHPRVAVDTQGNLIVLEENGQRLVKLDPTGKMLWSFGTPGHDDPNDNLHLNYPHGVATDLSGTIYVADGSRVQIFSSGGQFMASFGSYGKGTDQFDWITGIAVDRNGYIYIADGNNQRIKIFNSARQFVTAIGESDVTGADNAHFSYPIGVEVDGSGNLYVADIGNCRVQKFNSSHVYQMTFGSGTCASGIQDVDAEDVTVDAQGRVYVSGWNNRVQVFDKDGAYLTTIGGVWGSLTSQFRGASGVAVDASGNVYIADYGNARIEKFTPGIPGWKQANLNGFGTSTASWAMSLAVFNNQLYVGDSDWNSSARIYRSSDGRAWQTASDPGFGSDDNAVASLVPFAGQLYASTGWNNNTSPKILRSPDGSTWNPVVSDGFGDGNISAISTMTVFQNKLYAGTENTTDGTSIWRSDTGNPASWTSVFTGGHGDPKNARVVGFGEFSGYLYASVENEITGVEIWRTNDGTAWIQTNSNGFGNAKNMWGSGYAILNNKLYTSTGSLDAVGTIWATTDGTNWSPIVADGFGDPNNTKISGLYALSGCLYATTDNFKTGSEVWRSKDGVTWVQINPDGFGDANNGETIWSNATTDFQGHLFIGTNNNANGGEVWELAGFTTYLPLTLH